MSARPRNPTNTGSSFSGSPRRVSHNRSTIEQLADFFGREHRGLAFLDDTFGAAHRMGRIHIKDMADDEPVEQHTERG
jgi:hypothetical protein